MRYIDDQNMAVKPLAPGTRWVVGPWAGGLEGRMVVQDHLVEEDTLLPDDQRTMKELRKMADTISPMIQLEKDFGSKHNNGLLPILGLQVKVEQVEDTPKLLYYYYRKPMSKCQLMHANSAMPADVKRTSLTQYGLRILCNTKLEVPWSQKADMLSEFCARLRDSGYNQRYRQEVIQSVLRGWEKMVAEQEAGRRPIKRARCWQEV